MLLLAIADKTVGQNWLKFLKGHGFPGVTKTKQIVIVIVLNISIDAVLRPIRTHQFGFSSDFDFAIDGT